MKILKRHRIYYVIVVLIYMNLVFILPNDLKNYLPIFLLLFSNGYFGFIFAVKQLELNDRMWEKNHSKNGEKQLRGSYFFNVYVDKYSETDVTIKSLIEIVYSSMNSFIISLFINVALIILTFII